MKFRLFVALLLWALLASACDQAAQQPIAFPNRAYLGETISVAIDTDHPLISTKTFTLSTENLRIQLWDQTTDATLDLALRALVTGSSSLGTTSAEQDGATEVSIAVFDLPSTLPAGFAGPPTTVWVIPLFHPSLTPVAEQIYPTLEILGPASQGQGPTTFYLSPSPPEFSSPMESKLEPLPALRLRAKRPQFQSAWTIGSIEFEVVYPSSVSNPRAYPKITAARALAYATGLATGRVRVILVDPKGFKLKAAGATPTTLGAGPFVDVVFDQSAPFVPADFDIENLLVTDVNGNVLINDAGNSEEFFELYARANQ